VRIRDRKAVCFPSLISVKADTCNNFKDNLLHYKLNIAIKLENFFDEKIFNFAQQTEQKKGMNPF